MKSVCVCVVVVGVITKPRDGCGAFQTENTFVKDALLCCYYSSHVDMGLCALSFVCLCEITAKTNQQTHSQLFKLPKRAATKIVCKDQQAAAVTGDFYFLPLMPGGNLENHCLQFLSPPRSICRLGVLPPPAGVWHRILPLEDAGLTSVLAPDAHSKRSAAVQPRENSKRYSVLVNDICCPAADNKPGFEINTALSVCCSLEAAGLF